MDKIEAAFFEMMKMKLRVGKEKETKDGKKYSYVAIDEATCNMLADGKPLSIIEVQMRASDLFGKKIKMSRIRPHVENKEGGNPINKWALARGMSVRIVNDKIVVTSTR